jgi:hypothetical protein
MICQWSSRRLVFLLSNIIKQNKKLSLHDNALQFQYYYRNLSRQQAQQQAWLQKRRYNVDLIVHCSLAILLFNWMDGTMFGVA